MTTTWLAYFPSPPRGVWHLGPLPIRAYAFFIITGIVVRGAVYRPSALIEPAVALPARLGEPPVRHRQAVEPFAPLHRLPRAPVKSAPVTEMLPPGSEAARGPASVGVQAGEAPRPSS